MSAKILIIYGPNLNLLGTRQPDIYGNESLEEINNYIKNYFQNITFDFFQSNHEGEIIDIIQSADKQYTGMIINAGGYSHSSVAIHDVLNICPIPKIEVHLSNILNREEFRSNSITSKACNGSIIGLGRAGYIAAIHALMELLKQPN